MRYERRREHAQVGAFLLLHRAYVNVSCLLRHMRNDVSEAGGRRRSYDAHRFPVRIEQARHSFALGIVLKILQIVLNNDYYDYCHMRKIHQCLIQIV